MSINVIGTAGYQTVWHQARKAERNAASGAKTFMETVAEKSAQDKMIEYGEKVFAPAGVPPQSVKGHDPSRVLDSFARHAPEEVRQAFLEAEKETGGHFTVGGFWISSDGKEFHITQLAVECFIRWYHGDKNQCDVLGTSVGSAVSAVEKWIYGIDHPLDGQPAKNAEERKLIAMERAFCESFLEKLKKL